MTARWNAISDRFLAHAAADPDRIAAHHDERAITYRELAARASLVAQRLTELSLPPGSPVMVRLERSPELLAAMLGIWQAGLTYLPLDPHSPEHRVRMIARSARCSATISPTEHDASTSAPATADQGDGLSVSSLCTESPGGESHDLYRALVSDPGYVIYTSGSTGVPKGVVVGQRALVELIDQLVERYRVTPRDRVLQFAASSFDTSIEQICVALSAGATLVLPDHLWAPSEFHDEIARRRVTVMDLTPSYWREVAAASADRRRSDVPVPVRLVIFGGSAVYNQDLRLARELYPAARILNAYGLTETVITSCLAVVDHEDPLPDGPAAVGFPVDGVRVAILDDAGAPVPHGETGEVTIGGRLASGLIGEHAGLSDLATASIDGAPAFPTGDVGHLDAAGRFTVTGRKDRQVKVRGYRVDPSEIEVALQSHASVLDAAVLADDPDAGLAGFYSVLPGQADPGDTRLLDHLRSRLPSYAVPRRAVAMPTLPRTPHGKVDYRALAALDAESTTPSGTNGTSAAAETQLQLAVARVWGSVLDLEAPGLDQDFFEAGGTSITAAELVARTRTSLGIHLSYVRPLIEYLLARPTLRDFCAAVEVARAGRLESADAQRTTMHADLARAVEVDPTTFRSDRSASDPRRVLLTGATGFLGTHLLPRLLARTTARVTCLVRADSAVQGRRRLHEAWETYGCGGDPLSGADDRIDVLVGDLAAPWLGLSVSAFDRLAEETDMVIHSGGTVNFIYPYAEMKAANVDGTSELLRLAARRGAAFHHVSTVAVIAGHGVAGATEVHEDDPLDHLHELGVGYAESKWVAEHLVRRAGEAGLPVAIYRAADISGHSAAGTWNTATEMCCMKKFILDAGAVPDAELPMDYTPVDVFADALLHIALNEQPTRRTYHLTNPNKSHISLLADRLRARGHEIEQVDWEEWVARMVDLAVRSPDHPMTPFAPLFIDRCPSGRMSVAQMYLEDTFPRFGRANVDAALSDSDIFFPDVDARLIDLYLDFLDAKAFL